MVDALKILKDKNQNVFNFKRMDLKCFHKIVFSKVLREKNFEELMVKFLKITGFNLYKNNSGLLETLLMSGKKEFIIKIYHQMNEKQNQQFTKSISLLKNIDDEMISFLEINKNYLS